MFHKVFIDFFPNEGNDYYNIDSVERQDYVIDIAKHFFELGLKARIDKKSQLKEKIALPPDEFLVRCYQNNQLCYRKGEV